MTEKNITEKNITEKATATRTPPHERPGGAVVRLDQATEEP